MAFIKRTLRKYFFRFMGTDIPRMIVGLQGGPQPKNPDYVLLAPNQVKALHSMQQYAPKEQVRALFELYEKTNNEVPVNPITAIRIAKSDMRIITDSSEDKVRYR